MKFITDNQELITFFTSLCKKYNSYEWAVAWAGEFYGFDMAEILASNEEKIKKLAVGLHFYQTSPSFIKKFMGNVNVHFIMQSDGTFHSKVYLFYNSPNDWAAIVGSMNFTTSAFHKNSEAGMYFSSKDASVFTFNQIREYISEIWQQGKLFTDKDYATYVDTLSLQKAKLDSLSRIEISFDKVVASSLDVMTWPEYYKTIFENESFENISIRIELLNEARVLFASYESFDDMPVNTRKCLAGTESIMDGNSKVYDWKWFGNMEPVGYFKRDIINNVKLGKALDIIPLEGEVAESQFNDYCQSFYEYWDNPLACATRLLAIKRPDLFICIDSTNKQVLSEMLNVPQSKMTLQNYWNLVLKRLYESPWYRDNTSARGIELEIKKYKVAMLDAICYRHSVNKKENTSTLFPVSENGLLDMLENSGSSWLLPCSEKKFRFLDWLKDHDYVYWKQSVNLKPNDIVYIYGSAPTRAIICALVVDSVDYPAYPSEEERQYWVSPTSLTLGEKYAKLIVLALPHSRDALSFDNLQEHGLKVAPQKGVKLNGVLLEYICRNF